MARSKKAKITDPEQESICDQAWQHYMDYLTSRSSDDNEFGGDTDELVELLELIDHTHLPAALLTLPDITTASYPTRFDLLPVLASVAYTVLADEAIVQYLQHPLKQPNPIADQHWHRIKELLTTATASWPHNAAAWSMAANFARSTCHSKHTTVVLQWYLHAAQLAQSIRRRSIQWLKDTTVADAAKEWIEALLLQQVCGVELLHDDDDDDDDDEYGPSAMESTARFMASMICMRFNDPALAKQQLVHFDITHGLHPDIWNGQTSSQSSSNPTSNNTVTLYKGPNGVVPSSLYEAMCDVFQPHAVYWAQSNYNRRGYYSYWISWPQSTVQNLIDDVIVHHLLPLVLEWKPDLSIQGLEWWVHTRPSQAHLGHNLHFDTDENSLKRGSVRHPAVSAVWYLTGGTSSGATIVLDQTPDSTLVAPCGWRNVPQDNTVLLFEGNRLHGVLPCPGNVDASPSSTTGAAASVPNMNDLADDPPSSFLSTTPPHRLTFMVGVWTQEVEPPSQHQPLYGPCGRLPEPTDEHSWVRQLQQNYCNNNPQQFQPRQTVTQHSVPCIQPAWEELSSRTTNDDSPLLTIPQALDHRFFVRDAPGCFREALFEKDEFDDDDDDGGADSGSSDEEEEDE